MTTMTLDEVRKLPPLTKKEIDAIKKFKNTDFSDCTAQTPEQLKQFRPSREIHPELFAEKEPNVIHLDTDVLKALKAQGKESDADVNAILRQAVLG